jgi:hypothetical protein
MKINSRRTIMKQIDHMKQLDHMKQMNHVRQMDHMKQMDADLALFITRKPVAIIISCSRAVLWIHLSFVNSYRMNLEIAKNST